MKSRTITLRECKHHGLTEYVTNTYINKGSTKPRSRCIKCAKEYSSKIDHKKYYKENRKRLLKVKRDLYNKKLNMSVEYLGGKCTKCGITNPVLLDFHHIDPSCKDGDINKFLQKSWKNLKVELDKCILMCSNCHRLFHYNKRRTNE